MKTIAFITLALFVSSHSFAKSMNSKLLFESPTEQIHLLELFSSEGCSSCPPADKWMSELRQDKKLWKTFVPLNFHVDYWNQLGWVDRFSHSQYTGRQHRYVLAWNSNRVYTPGFVLNGKEWRSRDKSQFGFNAKKVGPLRVYETSNQKLMVEFIPHNQSQKRDLVAHVALLGNGLTTNVKNGENAGRTLTHEFVVLKLEQKKLAQKSGAFHVELERPQNNSVKPSSFSLAIWITDADSTEPIQSTGGDLVTKK